MLLSLSLLGIGMANAGVDNGKNTPVLPLEKSPEETSELKCWQGGRLIIDELNWVPDGVKLPGIMLRSQGGNFDVMWLTNFGDETFCFLRAKTVSSEQ